MKNLLLLLLTCMIVCSCQTYITIAPFKQEIVSLDYKRYSEKGFFITESYTVPFDYIPVGSVYAIVRSGEDRSKKPNSDDEYPIKHFNIYDAMDVLCDSVKALGGDGVMNFTWTTTPGDLKSGKNSMELIRYLDGVIVSGMAFKRK